jgi:hypothetical protein
MYVRMYVCMHKGGPKTGPSTATFNDLFGQILLLPLFSHFRISRWLNVTSILFFNFLHHEDGDVGSVADISDIHAAHIHTF